MTIIDLLLLYPDWLFPILRFEKVAVCIHQWILPLWTFACGLSISDKPQAKTLLTLFEGSILFDFRLAPFDLHAEWILCDHCLVLFGSLSHLYPCWFFAPVYLHTGTHAWACSLTPTSTLILPLRSPYFSVSSRITHPSIGTLFAILLCTL